MHAAVKWVSDNVEATVRMAGDVHDSEGYKLAMQSAQTLQGRDALLAQVCEGIRFGLNDWGGVRDIPPEHPVAVLSACYLGALTPHVAFRTVRCVQILSPALERGFAAAARLMRGTSALPTPVQDGNLRIPHEAAGFTVCFRATADREYPTYLDVRRELQRELAQAGHVLLHTAWDRVPPSADERVVMVCMVRSAGWHDGAHLTAPYFLKGQAGTDAYVLDVDCVLPRCIVRFRAGARKRSEDGS
tara:strand:- start:1589 stop:2323 length:735 start_codon:yes stop_codon:yes gene_type:complete